MKISFDNQIFTYQMYGGISRYYIYLALGILEKGHEAKIFAGVYKNNYLKNLPSQNVNGLKWTDYQAKIERVLQLLNHIYSDVSMKCWNPDVVHETYYSSLSVFPTNTPRLTTAHDMIHELYGCQFGNKDRTKLWKKSTFSRVDHIICVSNNTKKDLLDFYNIDEKKVSVVHHGVDSAYFKYSDIIDPPIMGEYLLYVGNRGGYKNFTGLLKAISSSALLKNKLPIVAFGGGKFSTQERILFNQLGFKESLIKHINGDDKLLRSLYANAIAFIYPSLYEGFGMPPLEAMAAGCPVIASNTSSIPEIVNNAGEYFSPESIESIRNAVEKVVGSLELRKTLISNGYQNVKNYTWNKCVDQTLAIYKKIQS